MSEIQNEEQGWSKKTGNRKLFLQDITNIYQETWWLLGLRWAGKGGAGKTKRKKKEVLVKCPIFLSFKAWVFKQHLSRLQSWAIPGTEFSNTAEMCHVIHPIELPRKKRGSTLSWWSEFAVNGISRGQWEKWQWEEHQGNRTYLTQSQVTLYMRREQRGIPRALHLTCINRMIPTNKPKSPLQNYVHILLTHMTVLAPLKSQSFHILHWNIMTGF